MQKQDLLFVLSASGLQCPLLWYMNIGILCCNAPDLYRFIYLMVSGCIQYMVNIL